MWKAIGIFFFFFDDCLCFGSLMQEMITFVCYFFSIEALICEREYMYVGVRRATRSVWGGERGTCSNRVRMCVWTYLVFWRRICKLKALPSFSLSNKKQWLIHWTSSLLSSFLCLSLYSFPNFLSSLSISLLPASTYHSSLYPSHHPLPSVPPCSPSIPKSPSIRPSIHPSLSFLSLSLSKGNIIENLAGTPKIESGLRGRGRAEERDRALEGEREVERRGEPGQKGFHISFFGWWFLFAVNNLLPPLFCMFCIW